MSAINYRLDDERLAALQQAAASDGCSLQKLLDTAVTEYLDRRERSWSVIGSEIRTRYAATFDALADL
jgi:hypothetical protein